MSKFDDIITAVRSRLEGIDFTSYDTGAGLAVFTNLEYQTEPPDSPCLIVMTGDIIDTLDSDPQPSNGEENHLLPLEIEGFIDDEADGNRGQALRQDILKALKTDPYFSGLTEGWSGAIESSAAIFDAGERGFRSQVQIRATVFYVTPYGGN